MTEHQQSVMLRRVALAYVLHTTLVFIGIGSGLAVRPIASSWYETMMQYDGEWYLLIAAEGYEYTPDGQSNVAFFPVYPGLARLTSFLSSLPAHWCLIAVSNIFFVVTLILVHRYELLLDRDASGTMLFLYALFPTSFFFSLPYSESVFATLVLLFIIGTRQTWSLFVLALIVGVATATRPVGVALVPAILYHVYRRGQSRNKLFRSLVTIGPLSVSGLLLYMLFQYFEFGTPFAFVRTQDFWRFREPLPISQKLISLFSLEPIWASYVPNWLTYCGHLDPKCPSAFLSLHAANPLIFSAAIFILAYGFVKRMLTAEESLVSFGLLMIPYFTRGYEMCMASHGRFVLVVIPLFGVLARIRHVRSRKICWWLLLAALSSYLLVYSFGWGRGHLCI